MVITYESLRAEFDAMVADAVEPELLAEANDMVMAGESYPHVVRHIFKYADLEWTGYLA